MDIFKKCQEYTDVREARDAGLYPYFIPLSNNEGTESSYAGRRLIMIGSNNYLGLTIHPKVRQAATDAIARSGTSCTGSRLLNGTLEMHLELERGLAEWLGKEAAIVFSTGYQANVGTISCLVHRDDFVITDKDDHASIIDGCRLSFGRMKRFPHNDIAALARVLESLPEKAGRLVVIDGVYSMGGDLALLPEIVAICKEHGARLMVDDAHGIGVVGGGRGTAAEFGLTEDVDLIMGTFSKSFASLGGFIAGDAASIEYIQHHARSLIFSASIPPANAAAAKAALGIMQEEPERITRLSEIGAYMREEYTKRGFNIGYSQTPIVPVIVGDDQRAFLFWKMLFEAGVYTNVVVSPAVPSDMALLRTSYMATHTDEQLNQVLDIMTKIGKELEVI